MVFFIQNCFHWIGYHIVNHLLELGHHVDGADDVSTDKKEHLSMFVGRNDLFRHVSCPQRDCDYDVKLSVYDRKLLLETSQSTTVKLPLVFGEWMPMDEKGMYVQDVYVQFNSAQFEQEAVYIGSMLKSLQQWVDANGLPPVLEVKSYHDRQVADETLENSIHIRNNRPIAETLNTVKKHYKKYEAYY